eukprot:TRINITY_DN1570_c0_g1_i1.p1 TRINITY_DN1570_c0_g1~~TRINITY_DN1570_c0_g1_i1.p1  ORF type:complete len:506 (+),score=90.45 TRINITY_DN1570_c0_g1_i1:124-1641(+)
MKLLESISLILWILNAASSTPRNLLFEIREAQTSRQTKRINYEPDLSSNSEEPMGSPPQPTILNQGDVFQAELGESIRLPCHTNDLGPMILLWKKGNRVLTAGETKVRRDSRMQLLGNDLEISNLKKSDGGDYICELETDAVLPSAITHTVEILVPPNLSTNPSNGQIVVKKGTTVSLTCHATGNPEPTIEWEKVHERLPKGDIRVDEKLSSTLTLTDVTRHHAGVYKCTAKNGVGSHPVEQEIHLQVLYEPEAKPEQLQVHGGIGYQVELVCVVYAEPLADVLWYKDTMLLDSNGKRYMQQKGNRYTLLIRDVEKSDFGNYSCSASNMLGKSRAYLRVVGNPNTPVFNSHVTSESPTSYKLSWITESYSRIMEYRLLYRRLPDDPSQDILYAYNNIIINGEGTHGLQHHQSYILDSLSANSLYEAQIQARNSFGWSDISEKFQFYTRQTDSFPMESSVKNPATAQEFGFASSSSQIRSHWMLGGCLLISCLLLFTSMTQHSSLL